MKKNTKVPVLNACWTGHHNYCIGVRRGSKQKTAPLCCCPCHYAARFPRPKATKKRSAQAA